MSADTFKPDIVIEMNGQTPVAEVAEVVIKPDPHATERELAQARIKAHAAGAGNRECLACGKGFKRRRGGPQLCGTCDAYNANRLANAVNQLIYQLENLKRLTKAPAVERIYEIGKGYIALVPVIEGAETIIGWKIAERRDDGRDLLRALQPALFKQYADARNAADAIAKARNNPGLAGRIYEFQVGDLADSDWTEPELYEHAERMSIHFAAEEARLRPVLTGKEAVGGISSDLTIVATWAIAGPDQIRSSNTTSRLRCRRCKGMFEMPAATYARGGPGVTNQRLPGLPGGGAPDTRVPIPAATFCAMCAPAVQQQLAKAVLEIDRMMRTMSDKKPTAPNGAKP